MNSYITAEFSSVTLRLHPSGMGFGSPYINTCRATESPEEKGTAYLAAMQGTMQPWMRSAIARMLKQLGIERVRFSIKGRWHTYSLARWAE